MLEIIKNDKSYVNNDKNGKLKFFIIVDVSIILKTSNHFQHFL